MEKKRNSFLFYYSYYDAIKDLPADEQGFMYKIIVDYAMLQIEPDITNLSPMQKMAFKLVKPNIDASIRKWKNGLKGGAPAGNQNARKQPKNNQQTSKKQPENNLETSRYIKEQEKEQKQEFEQEQEKEQTNQQTSVSSFDSLNSKTLYFLEILTNKVNVLLENQVITETDALRLKELFNRVASETEIKINKTVMHCSTVLEKYIDFFREEKDSVLADKIGNFFGIIDNTSGIKNKLKYSIGVFYNKSTGY